MDRCDSIEAVQADQNFTHNTSMYLYDFGITSQYKIQTVSMEVLTFQMPPV